MFTPEKVRRTLIVACLTTCILLSVSGCAEKPAEINITGLADFQSFMNTYPFTEYSYASSTPPGTDQIIEVRADLNRDGLANEGDGPVEARGKTTVPKVVIVRSSIELQLFFAFYGNGAGVSIETSPIDLRNEVELTALPETKPAFVAIHKSEPSARWGEYSESDGPPLAFAYLEPAAIAEYKKDKLSWVN